MTTKHELCSTIETVNPDMGVCDVDFDVAYSKDAKAWIIRYSRDGHTLSTHVEDNEAQHCMDEDRCIPLALQLGQLKFNFEKYIHEHALENEH